MRPLLFIASLVLLIASAKPALLRARVETQRNPRTSDASVANPIAQVPAPSGNKTIAVVLSKALEAKKLKGGENFVVTAPDVLLYTVAHAFEPIVLRVVGASPRGKDGSESRIAIRFERLHPDPAATQAPLDLTIQAIVAPFFTTESNPMSIVIIDHFPCDPKVSRDGCDKENKNGDPDPNFVPPELFVCKSKQPSSNVTPQRDCVGQNESQGTYGYPDLHLLASDASTKDTSTISAEKKEVTLKKGTYLILAGPDIETILQRKP